MVGMARRWTTLKVELLGGRDERLDPPPGRVLILPPGLTFNQLGEAIDRAMGRWDLAQLRQFTLADGTAVAAHASARMSLDDPIDDRVRPGESEFAYIFSAEDGWTHRCRVLGTRDPVEEVGHLPTEPVAIRGWGTLSDQHGRITSELDEPDEAAEREEVLDLRRVDTAIARADAQELLDAATGVQLDYALQQLGSGVLTIWPEVTADQLERFLGFAAALHQGLQARQQLGDRELAAELLAALRGADPTEGVLVSLDELDAAVSHGHDDHEPGGYLNLRTGEVIPPFLTDETMVGEDAAVDVEGDDWAWVSLDRGPNDWQDMADFTVKIQDERVRTRLADAIEGKGAFSRFRRALPEEYLDEWLMFRTDRRWGWLRAELAYLDKNLHGR